MLTAFALLAFGAIDPAQFVRVDTPPAFVATRIPTPRRNPVSVQVRQ